MKSAAFYTLAVLAVLAAAFGNGTALLNTQFFMHDFWFVTDVMWRAHLGQTPHIDVLTPVGQGFFWPYAISTALIGPGVPAMLLGSTIVGAVAALLSWVMLRHTTRPEVWILVGLFAAICAVNPRFFGLWIPDEFNHLAPYNRWGWALLAPLAVFAFAPPSEDEENQTEPLGAALFGLTAAFLVLMKITFGIVAFGYLIVSVVLLRRNLKEAAIALVSAALLMGAVQLLEQNLAAYVDDIKAAWLSSDTDMMSKIRERKWIALAGVFAGIAALVILLMGAFSSYQVTAFGARLALVFRPLVFCAATVVSGFMLAAQNYPKHETPFFVVTVLIAYAWARRWWSNGLFAPMVAFASYGLIALAVLLTLGRGIAGIGLHRMVLNGADAITVPAFDGTPLQALHLPQTILQPGLAPPPQDATKCRGRYGWSESQLRRTVDHLHLLRGLDRSAPVVLPLDGFNPYPALLEAPAPTGTLLWADPGRTISVERHPPAKQMFQDVEVVLRPVECRHDVSTYLWDIYGNYISANYTLTAQSDLTEMWVRK